MCRRGSAPAARHVYELTDDGRDLSEAAVPLIGWGARPRPARAEGELPCALGGAGNGEHHHADREAARGVSETYQYGVGETTFHFVVDDGSIELRDGRADDPDLTLTTDEDTLASIMSGTTTASEAASTGAMTVEGDRQAAKRLGRIFARERILAGAAPSIAR